ncbi:hypothetical protein PTKU15_79580 [Paraburkholderia terrae]|nr:hypothetical protein PTKU15_79580 [Paraburkholderia terrae]
MERRVQAWGYLDASGKRLFFQGDGDGDGDGFFVRIEVSLARVPQLIGKL